MSKKGYNDIFYYLSLLGHLGFIIIGNILIFIFFYKVIENFTGRSTLLFLAFLIAGIILAFYNAYKLIMRR